MTEDINRYLSILSAHADMVMHLPECYSGQESNEYNFGDRDGLSGMAGPSTEQMCC